MSNPSITFFPVGNGDTTLITLSDKTNILVDCNLKKNTNDDAVWNVHEALLEAMRNDSNKRPHLDVFILTHPDQDHCLGFKDKFYQGTPGSYSEQEAEDKRIIIDEIWFAPRLFHEYDDPLCGNAAVFKEEVDRRIELYCAGDPASQLDGNRVRVIGATDHPALAGLEQITIVAGAELMFRDDFTIFVHAPFKANTDNEEGDRNESSIVLQLRFDIGGQDQASLVLLGGDATYSNWERIIDRSDDEVLAWDLFLAPHHVSWSYFGPVPYDPDMEASAASEYLLQLGRQGAHVIASCKPIEDNDDNPPHYAAYQKYQEVVVDNIICLATASSELSPEPITFVMTENGPVREEKSYRKAVQSAAVAKSVSTPRTYG